MFDFVVISYRQNKGCIQVYPKFIIGKHQDLMIRGGDFYAVWLEDKKLWSTDEQDVINYIDRDLRDYVKEKKAIFEGQRIEILEMSDSDSGSIDRWHKYVQKQLRDKYCPLDKKLIFANDETTRDDYASKKLPYALIPGDTSAYDELIGTLYSETERAKIEWAIGAIVTGDSKTIEKFMVLYGAPGTGKGTVLKIFEKLFHGYTSVFDAESLGSATSQFALEQFKKNPLVAICPDGDLNKLERNTRLNSITSHEEININEKHKSQYSLTIVSFLIMGTNKPVKITDAKSGLIRRLIDVNPIGNKIPSERYHELMKKIEFELGAIASKCKDIYLDNPLKYETYKPLQMLSETNDFYNFVLDSYTIFKNQDGCSLKQAWELYKRYVEDARVPYPMSMKTFRSELKNYFKSYEERTRINGELVRSWYSGFKLDEIEGDDVPPETPKTSWIKFKAQHSILDDVLADAPAQYGTDDGKPHYKWANVTTTLKDIDTSKLHYVKMPDEHHIVVDFDIKDREGNKSYEKNLEAASKWPKTYAELSKSGAGIHLHYIYAGDPTQLSAIYDDNIEVKVFNGNSSLRRKLTKCNNLPIATINSGLPLKKEIKMINFEGVANEKAIRTLIRRNLNKEYHGATKPSVDFIYDTLEKAYASGMHYDVSDLHQIVLAFAASSTNQADYCINLVGKMKWKSDDISEPVLDDNKPIVFFDVEVFPNLFLINWKKLGSKTCSRMINPTPVEVEKLFNYRLVGFNCRQYDNHMLYARAVLAYNELDLYHLSQQIINKGTGFFGEAYNISYTDIYDYADTKQSLKKWEIELGIHHQELGLPWDQPVPEEKWPEVAAYCDNDVISTEAVWNATQGDFLARQILAEITGLTVNDKTNTLTTRLIFGKERHPQLNYVDLSKEFPGYKFVKEWDDEAQKYNCYNMYRGIDLGFGGYVYSEPGMYGDVALDDVESLHPHSIIAMNLFGDYTKNFADLVQVRIYIKHKNYAAAKKMFGGKLAPYLEDESTAKQLSKALKIAINSVYGLTSAKFDNPFRDPRNENNIVALRGALFMKTLQDEVVARGYKVAHIKTDSIKIPDADMDILNFCAEFAKKYGYTFAHEATYEKFCLVNDAVYIARYATLEHCSDLYSAKYVNSSGDVLKDNKEHPGSWTATGTQFQIPYVFKKCFSKEAIEFKDLCEAKQVKSAMHLDMNEGLPEGEHDYKFVGRVGLFCPIKPGCGGGQLLAERKKADGSTKLDAVTGTKGYRWLESEEVKAFGKEDDIDISYYNALVDDAIDAVKQYGDYEWFASDEPYVRANA